GGPDREVPSAVAKKHGENVDRPMEAQLRFKSGVTGTVNVSMWSWKLLDISCGATGTLGEMSVFNPVMPQAYHRLPVKTEKGKRTEHLGKRPSHLYPLEAYTEAGLRGIPVLTCRGSRPCPRRSCSGREPGSSWCPAPRRRIPGWR